MATYRRRPPRPPVTLNGVGDTVGAKLWEWLHPEQVRAEYEMQMKTPPADVSLSDVIDTATTNTLDAARAAGEYGRQALQLAKYAAIGGAVLYGLTLLNDFSKRRRR